MEQNNEQVEEKHIGWTIYLTPEVRPVYNSEGTNCVKLHRSDLYITQIELLIATLINKH